MDRRWSTKPIADNVRAPTLDHQLIILTIKLCLQRDYVARVCCYQRWNWVIGPPGHLGHLLRRGHPVTGSSFWPGARPEFSRFSKKMPKMQSVHLKCWNNESHCQVSVVGLKSLDVSPRNEPLLLPMIITNSLAWEYFYVTSMTSLLAHSYTSWHLEFIIEQGHRVNCMDLRVAGFPGHWVAGSQNVTQFHVWGPIYKISFFLISLFKMRHVIFSLNEYVMLRFIVPLS